MRNPFIPILPISLLFTLLCTSTGTLFRPKALILPVKKDASTHQYLTRLSQRTPLVHLILAIDLGSQFMWVNCDSNYVSSSYRPVPCRSGPCSAVRANSCGSCNGLPRPGCNNNTCGGNPSNPFIGVSTLAEMAEDVISIASTDGFNYGPSVVVRDFVFVCGSNIIVPGLAKGATGLVGLGRSPIGLPLQFAKAFSFPRKFALCLPSSTTAQGVIFFGNGPYNLLPGKEISRLLAYTPLYINPVSTAATYVRGEKSVEYFIGVKSIAISGRPLRINASLLVIDKMGYGGTKISTVDRFTLLQTSIYRTFTSAFIREAQAMNITRVDKIAPFEVCFSTTNVLSTRAGPAVPSIRLGVEGANVPSWTITGSNSMVFVKDKVICLGFMDGGENPRSAIILGGFQLENNLLQFDLAGSRLGFSSTLLGYQTTCSNFNFTTVP